MGKYFITTLFVIAAEETLKDGKVRVFLSGNSSCLYTFHNFNDFVEHINNEHTDIHKKLYNYWKQSIELKEIPRVYRYSKYQQGAYPPYIEFGCDETPIHYAIYLPLENDGWSLEWIDTMLSDTKRIDDFSVF